jgi:hypothetical protein
MKVVVASGHLTDRPDRASPRFPESAVVRVRRQIARALDEIGLGRGDLLICGGARGADLLAAEEALRRGASVRLCLAGPRASFVPESVALAGTDWSERFDHVASCSDLRVVPAVPAGANVYEATNDWMITLALAEPADERHALLVWDGRQGDGAGGTGHFGERASSAGLPLTVIHPL